jgi:hypothetical protein
VLTQNASSGFLVSTGFLFLLKNFKSQKKMGIWVLKSFSPHHLCLLTMKGLKKFSHPKAWHEQSSQKQQQQQHEHEEETKMQKSKQRPKKKVRLQFYNITNRTTPKRRRRRKHPTTKEVK